MLLDIDTMIMIEKTLYRTSDPLKFGASLKTKYRYISIVAAIRIRVSGLLKFFKTALFEFCF